jgi:hypothetical protein
MNIGDARKLNVLDAVVVAGGDRGVITTEPTEMVRRAPPGTSRTFVVVEVHQERNRKVLVRHTDIERKLSWEPEDAIRFLK